MARKESPAKHAPQKSKKSHKHSVRHFIVKNVKKVVDIP
jgi:hypothetical protein